MPKLSSNSLNGLVSELNGFHQHAHRFETLDQTFGILPNEGLEFARPVFSSARNEMTWHTERSLPNARPLTAMGAEERKVAEMHYNQCIHAIQSRLEKMPNGDKRLEQFKKFVRIPDVSSILVVPIEGGHSFVLINWGTRDSSIPNVDPEPIVSFETSALVLSGSANVPQANKKLMIQVGSQEPFPEFTNAEGLIDLKTLQKGTSIRISQPPREWVKEENFNEQKFTVESQAQQPMRYQWSVVAAARVSWNGSPADEGWEQLLFQSGALNKELNLSAGEKLIDGLVAGEIWSISVLSDEEKKELKSGVIEEGLNRIELDFRLENVDPTEPPEPLEPPTEPPTPASTGPMTVKWESFWGRPIKLLPFAVKESGATERDPHKTDGRGYAELGELTYGGKYELSTKWWGREWRFTIEHDRGIAEHVVHLKAPVPWWLLASMGALLLLTLIGFWRVPYTPDVRLIDAETEQPIANGAVEYYNFEGQRLVAESDGDGHAELLVGERPFYKKLFQLNPSTPLQAVAPGYESARSTMKARTWYWTQDWPLEPDHEVSLEIETYDAGNQVPLPGTFVELRTKSMSGDEASLFSGYSDGNGKIQVTVDDRDFIVSNAQKATYVELNRISATGKSMLAGDEEARRIRLAPTVGCDRIYNDQEGNSTRAFDLGQPNMEFCFQVCNYSEMDNIVVLDANREVLFNLDTPTNSELNPFSSKDPATYIQKMLTSPTQIVYVELRDGGTNWWFELNCPQSGCLDIQRHPWYSGDPT